MACTSPIRGYRNPSTGKLQFTHRSETMGRFGLVTVRCGMCMGCRIDKARDWGIRCWHESQMHQDNCFITLTYDHHNVPQHHSLCKEDLRSFIRKLRRKLRNNVVPRRIRYFAGGEYGGDDKAREIGRPHYHAIIFGWRPWDGKICGFGKKNTKRYTSEYLTDTWGMGMTEWGEVSFRSANYTAKYCLKKINGKMKDEINEDTGLKPYERLYELSGEIVEVEPEFQIASTHPGIGEQWFKKNWKELYSTDNVIGPEGQEWPVPEYYDRLLKVEDQDLLQKLKRARSKKAKEYYASLDEDAIDEHQRILATEANLKNWNKNRGNYK